MKRIVHSLGLGPSTKQIEISCFLCVSWKYCAYQTTKEVFLHFKIFFHILEFSESFSIPQNFSDKLKIGQNFRKTGNTDVSECVCMSSLCFLKCVCEFVSTVNRGHTPEDGPRFVDTCERLQIAYSCI